MKNRIAALLIAALSLSSIACTTVNPGEVGVEVQFGKIQGGVLSPGSTMPNMLMNTPQ